MILKNLMLAGTALGLSTLAAIADDRVDGSTSTTQLASLTGAEASVAHPDIKHGTNSASLTSPLPDPDKLIGSPPAALGEPSASDVPGVDEEQDAFVPEKAPISAVSLAIESIVGELFNTGDAFERKDREAIADFYGERDYEPVWVKEGVLSEEANLLMERLQNAAADGLDPTDYPVYELDGLEDAEAVAGAEIQLTETLLKYARHAQAGRLVPSRVSSGFKNKPVYPEPSEVLVKISNSVDKVAALSSYNPPHKGFKALKAELARLQTAALIEPSVIIPAGKTLYKGIRSDRVALLRDRLNVPVLGDEDPRKFDEPLVAAVRAFQKEHNLVADAVVGPKTLRFLNGKTSNRVHDIIANMERWRWLPRDMGNLHVVANVPSYDATVYKNGENIHRTRVVVGKTKHATPIFSDHMEYVVVNPHWNVPYSIASKELLPKIRSNPSYVSSRNYEIIRRGRVVDPRSVKWDDNSFRRVRIRQKPGGRNALGLVKFLFPNDYAIYFHDTPSKSLFQRVSRAFSHGCVRIHRPFEFGDVLLKHSKGWNKGRLRSMVGGKEKFIRLKGDERIQVHLTYFTAVADDAGKISYKSDLYGHHRRVKRALGLL